MPRLSTRALLVVVITLLLSPMACAQEPTLGERLLPKSTKGAILVTNPKQLSDHWTATQLGQLMNDPVMKPFTEDLRRQFQDRWARIRDRLGLRLDDLKGVPGGEMAVAMIAPAKGEAAVALLLDVTDHVPQAQALLDKVTANLIEKGAKQTRKTVEGTTVIVFDLPKTQESPAGLAVYFLSGNLLGAADDQGVIEAILRRKLGQAAPGDSLADLPAFGAVMNRCRQHAKTTMPQIRWFIEPLGYVEAVRAATPEEKRRKGVTVLDVLRDQGFTAVQGVGGFVDLKVDGYEVLHRTAVYAPKPYKPAPAPYENRVSMNMFVLPNGDGFALPAWIPNDIAGCTTFNWDILGAFDNLGPTFDQLVGEGETGVWDDVLNSLKDDPNGPQIDLRSELIVHLGQRVTTIKNYRLPITITSERLLFAVETRDEAAVAAGIKKMLKDDPTIKHREFEGLDIWETVEQQQHKIPNAPLVDLPSLGSKEKQPGKAGRRRLVDEEDEEQRLLPHAAVTVVNGHLLVASHYDFLIEVLQKAKKPDPLAQSMDYRVVDGAMKQLGAGANCIRSFSRTDEAYRPTYELIRMGKMPESQAMLGRILNALLGPRKKGAVREQKVDGAKMPDYQVVRRYLGPAGAFGTTEDQGWFIVGFTLKK